MDNHDPNHQHSTLWWITSLAISVVCCAVLFVIFAGYVVSIKEDLSMARLRGDMAEQRLNLVNTQIEMLFRRTAGLAVAGAPKLAPPASANDLGTVPATEGAAAPAKPVTTSPPSPVLNNIVLPPATPALVPSSIGTTDVTPATTPETPAAK